MDDRLDEIVVIGAGAVGATIALELSRAGKPVRLIDGGDGPGAGCSYANAGLLSPSHVDSLATPTNIRLGLRYLFSADSPFRLSLRPSLVPWLLSFVVAARPRRSAMMTARLQAMAKHSLALHLAYPDQGIATGVKVTGSLDAYLTAGEWERALRTYPDALRLTGPEVAAAVPGLSGVVGAVSHPEDATCNTLQYVSVMIDAARAHGAEVQWSTRVTDLTVTDGHIDTLILSDGTQLRPRQVVLAAGLGTEYLCRRLGLRIPMQPATGYVIDVPTSEQAPPCPVTLQETKVVITPLEDRLRAAGTLDLSGQAGQMKVHRLEAVRKVAAQVFPRIDWSQDTDTWSGDRPSTSDGVPVIGTSRHVDGVVVAAGHGMWGLLLAPITAEWVRRGLDGDTSALSEPALSPDRFTRRRTGR